MGRVVIDGKPVAINPAAEGTVAAVFAGVRDEILRSGRIITDVRIGDEPVTWDDGHPAWNLSVADSANLDLKTDYPIRISGPLVERVIGTLDVIARQHQELAEAFRAEDRNAFEAAAQSLGAWQELQHVLDQVCILHGIDLEAPAWKPIADSLRERFGKLEQLLKEMKDSLEHGDMVLTADLLEFELAPLAEEFVAPCKQFHTELERQYHAPESRA